MRLLKGCIWFLVFAAVLHTAVGLAIYGDALHGLLVGGVGPAEAPRFDRLAALWFMFSGLLMFAIAGLSLWVIRKTGALPIFLGIAFLAFALVGGLVLPVSGFWLFIPPGLGIVAHALKGARPGPRAELG
ncbi:hypothetical protein GM415_02835 [Pseudodesulfovibrio cashew]|uniref:Uncharacterized protein n=1 Tax=Pseudodesulfovibrio cashew TaxID=2678688 RepID=A0A6I6JFC0_9BACT|nr:DUF6463 family protein [Pseudodesulfovibrio cashew]QGY39102.1 hypothetical protein GM415_02835 [Pseudodesulfovibrio cashew]